MKICRMKNIHRRLRKPTPLDKPMNWMLTKTIRMDETTASLSSYQRALMMQVF